MKKIRVMVAGAGGKMGQEVVRALLREEDMALVGAVDVKHQGRDVGYIAGNSPLGIDVLGVLTAESLREVRADILVDFTNPQSVLKNAETAIAAGVVPVIGTTGLDEAEIGKIRELVAREKVGAFIAPNFALGAILMLRFAKEAARFFPHVEIIELHHDEKLDAPSGTALKVAEWIGEVRAKMAQGNPNEYEKLPGARGADIDGIHIHSVRLPGYIAHHQVLFGGSGQALTIRHDAFSRETYMPGVMLAIRKSYQSTKLTIGLENFLD
ncbi:4-hydroxy-tetrahydrodipicolinate reductase [Acididesulfobacillus acetoxydans]|uniref:4-hydroxy-tetrahydrodipicolinate reductase n=1 Tax=Acididesulfobacillus acetoxydans TaxID=1561005 RepID=A0A8S0Y3X2_9FIRM|nr:4-hydroxy-tetrahydrodipicolinate reductase [Acididesulfobacillus acetoxydans]CAA7602525.1 4-hydroxy-tetrahydrodipicolinate reductase [Acididesulfobacillus acetoxydans]CEJ06524.1 4-hydroxy-tetrahydrodipicolinate reductase [Acididesulfobacillus acetoxydans]